jgi:metallophosphoesterase (TIGR03767 family)
VRASPLCLAALAVAAAWVPGGCGGGGDSERPDADKPASTLAATWVDRDGDGVLEVGPGEPLRDRTELAPATRPGPELARLAQVSDVHIADEQSPARPTFLDRLGTPFTSTFRPQEALAPHVLAAALEAIDGARVGALVVTGDLIDNAQSNELEQALAVLGGGRVDPSSGARRYEGVQRRRGADPFYYRPGVDAPRKPGLLAAAQRPFRSPGIRAPWFAVTGNHDLLVQGELAPTPTTRALAVGDRAVETLDRSALDRLPDDAELNPATVDEFLREQLAGRTAARTPDAARRELDPAETLARLRAGNGAGATGSGERLDYAFDIGPSVRGIALDLVDRAGGSRGTVDPAQAAWLEAQLARAGSRWVLVFSHQPLDSSAGGERLLALLDASPRVVATVSGHTHRNAIEPRSSPAGGYWQITTASLIAHPQQARALRLVETAGGVALETWMLDHGAGPGGLAADSRELAFLDAQGGRPRGFAGQARDRNARLFLARPAGLAQP